MSEANDPHQSRLHILTEQKLGYETGLGFIPPLLVYFAAGVSGLTTLAGTFVVKEELSLSAEFLATLGFWIAIPLSLKIPTGHLVDLLWKYKTYLLFAGAILIAASLSIMLGLITDRAGMVSVMSESNWFFFSAILGPTGYMLQDAVADAMTVEAVPRRDDSGGEVPVATQKQMHARMQTLGRVALVSGHIVIGVINVVVFSGVSSLTKIQQAHIYAKIYLFALSIPVISVIGVTLAWFLRRRKCRRLVAAGFSLLDAQNLASAQIERPPINWWIINGSGAFILITVILGVFEIPGSQEWVFGLSLAIVGTLLGKLLKEIPASERKGIVGTALVIFVFRAIPGPGVGPTWWSIDILRFDQQFLALLDLISSVVTFFALLAFRRAIAGRSVISTVATLTVLITLMTLPNIGLFYGVQRWTSALTNGIVDARFIALVDGAVESPLMQIVWVPMLAWVAHSAPSNLKATYFAVMTTFINLGRSAGQLGTKYLTSIFVIKRGITDSAGAVVVEQDYSQVGRLFIVCTVLGVVAPFIAIFLLRRLWSSATNELKS